MVNRGKGTSASLDGQTDTAPARGSLPSRLLACALGLGLSAGLAACANRTDPAIVNTASYQSGYSDGCTTANERRAGFPDTERRNEILFRTDEAYRIGWNQGFGTCGGRESMLSDDFLQDDRFDQGPI